MRPVLQINNSHTKDEQYGRRLPRLENIAYDINEMSSIDLADEGTLAEYSNGVKYLSVAVDVLSRKLSFQPVRIKGAEETAKTFDCRITKNNPLRVSSDEGNEIKGAFKNF